MSDEQATPPAEGGTENTTLVKTQAQTISVADMCPDKIAEVNPGVNAWKAKVGELEKEKEEMAAKLKDREKDLEELEGFRKAKAEAEKAELQEAVTYMKAKMGPAYDKAFPPEVEPTLEALTAQREILDALPTEEAPAEEAPDNAGTEPGVNAEATKKVCWALKGTGTAGTSGQSDDPYGDDGKFPDPY